MNDGDYLLLCNGKPNLARPTSWTHCGLHISVDALFMTDFLHSSPLSFSFSFKHVLFTYLPHITYQNKYKESAKMKLNKQAPKSALLKTQKSHWWRNILTNYYFASFLMKKIKIIIQNHWNRYNLSDCFNILLQTEIKFCQSRVFY